MNRSPLLCAILLCASPSFAQSGTLDQSAIFSNASFNGQASLVWQIEVKAGMDGTLEGFNMMLQGNAGLTIDFAIRRGSGWNTSPILFQGTTTLAGTGTWELHFIDASSAAISLVTDELFVIEVLNGDIGVSLQGHYDVLNPSYPQFLYLGGPGCFADCGWRIGFETYMLVGPSTPILAVTNLAAGALATLDVTNATPLGAVQIALSLAGGGPTGTPFGIADLSPPIRPLPPLVADVNGGASISINVPAGTSGTTVWLQALDFGSVVFSNGLQEVVL